MLNRLTVEDLVSLWRRYRQRGQEIAPADLCRGCSELLPELERRVGAFPS